MKAVRVVVAGARDDHRTVVTCTSVQNAVFERSIDTTLPLVAAASELLHVDGITVVAARRRRTAG